MDLTNPLVLILLILTTAIVTSALTLGVAWLLYENWLKDQIQAEMDDNIEKLGRTMEERVKKGIRDGVSSIPSTEVLRDTTRTMTETGVNIIGQSLGVIFGKPKKKDD